MKKALTIAGSDSSGGAGIQADLKTFQEFGVYGMSSLTVIVAMDPHNNWNHQVFPVDLDIIKCQAETVIAGIGVDAMKTGMLPTPEIIEFVAHTLKKHKIKNVVVDPVMVCKGAGEPVSPEGAECYKRTLVPLAAAVTPNIFEASQLSGIKDIKNIDDMKQAAQIIKETGAGCVVIKGGKFAENENAVDVFYDGKKFEILEAERIDTKYTHGAGCTFSAAAAAELAKGSEILNAFLRAKRFVTEAIRNSFALNRFVGPLDHSAYNKL
ncbi:MAG: pyridoxine/pyridoxal/pyridoxamine kinase [Oscillospiraceae bacterium]|nr:pyridoxine/pyridoxal/pyridoxamine kinase [Oscillospiraceae bacterium]